MVSGEPVLSTESKALERPIRGDERKIVGDSVNRNREIEVAHPVAGSLESGLSLAKAPAHFVIPGKADQLRSDRGPLSLECPATLGRREVAQAELDLGHGHLGDGNVFARRAATSSWPRIKAETVLVSSRYLKGQGLRFGIGVLGWPPSSHRQPLLDRAVVS